MTREIKFRAWDIRPKKMYFGHKDGWSWFSDVYMPEDFTGERYILMQYTGLKDKHGIEIYEGDIGRSVDEVLWEVKYDTVLARFIGLYDGNVIEDLSEVHDSMEIIGNIYENPELLNTK